MSHFAVLVISDAPLNERTLTPILQPWHEFESTGTNDKYVIDVDKTQEALEDYATQTKTMIASPEGALFDTSDDRFYPEPTPAELESEGGQLMGHGSGDGFSWSSRDWGDGRGHRAKVRFIPDGWAQTEVPVSKLMTQAEFVEYWYSAKLVKSEDEVDREGEHEYGYALVRDNGDLIKLVDRTNPNAKWDWWQIGGSWSGMFKPHYDPKTDPDNQETCYLCHGTGKRTDMGCENGCNGCSGTGIKTKWPSKWTNVGNVAQLKDIPVEAIRNEAEIAALKAYDKAIEIIAGRPFKLWAEVRAEHGDRIDDDVRAAYHDQPVIVDLRKSEALSFFSGDEDLAKFRMSRAEVATRARRHALQTFAVVKDGKWYERGEMGWFACVSDEKDPDVWDREFASLIDGLSPETWLAVVDCHI